MVPIRVGWLPPAARNTDPAMTGKAECTKAAKSSHDGMVFWVLFSDVPPVSLCLGFRGGMLLLCMQEGR